ARDFRLSYHGSRSTPDRVWRITHLLQRRATSKQHRIAGHLHIYRGCHWSWSGRFLVGQAEPTSTTRSDREQHLSVEPRPVRAGRLEGDIATHGKRRSSMGALSSADSARQKNLQLQHAEIPRE